MESDMGYWGTGNFDNDDAMDWVEELQHGAGLDAMTRVLCASPGGACIEAPDASRSLAAAEVVAALLGRPASDLPVEVARWVSENRGHDARALREAALHHVRAIVSDNSELRELVEENEAEYPFWKARQESLIARLEAAGG